MSERTDVVKVNHRGRITIPKQTRDELGIEEDDYIVLKVSKIEDLPT